MPAHAPVAVPAKAWTLLAQLADGESCTVSSKRPREALAVLPDVTIVRVAPDGDEPEAGAVGDPYEVGDVVVYDGPNDLYVWSDRTVTLAVAS